MEPITNIFEIVHLNDQTGKTLDRIAEDKSALMQDAGQTVEVQFRIGLGFVAVLLIGRGGKKIQTAGDDGSLNDGLPTGV